MSNTANKLGGGNLKSVFLPSRCFYDVPRSSVKHIRKSDRPTRTVVIEKETFINNLGPPKSGKGNKANHTTSTLSSRELILQKYFEDTGVNTTVSGVSQNDNECNTMVRRREDNKCPKCVNKTRFLSDSKAHKKKFSSLDKACSIVIQTVSCGTQFYENVKKPNSIKFNIPRATETQTQCISPHKEVGMQVMLCPDRMTCTQVSDYFCNNQHLRYSPKQAKRYLLRTLPQLPTETQLQLE